MKIHRILGANCKFTDESKVSGYANTGKNSSAVEYLNYLNLILIVKFLLMPHFLLYPTTGKYRLLWL